MMKEGDKVTVKVADKEVEVKVLTVHEKAFRVQLPDEAPYYGKKIRRRTHHLIDTAFVAK